MCWICNVHSNDCGTTCMQQCDNNVDCTLNWLNLSHSNVCFFELSAQQQNSSKLPQGDINANLATANISHLLALCSNKHLFNFYAYEFSVTSRQCRPKRRCLFVCQDDLPKRWVAIRAIERHLFMYFYTWKVDEKYIKDGGKWRVLQSIYRTTELCNVPTRVIQFYELHNYMYGSIIRGQYNSSHCEINR